MKPRLEKLEVLRAFACIGVFLTHCYLALLGSLSVSIFIMLSGFLMTYSGFEKASVQKPTLGDCVRFAQKKIEKLYRLYFLTLVFLVLRLVILAPENPPMDSIVVFAKQFCFCVTLTQSWIPNTSWNFAFNGVGWYLSSCLLLFLFFPLILHHIRGCKNIRSALVQMFTIYAVMIAVAAVVTIAHKRITNVNEEYSGEFQYWFTYVFPVFRLGDFSIGCLLAYIFLHSKDNVFFNKYANCFEILAIALTIVAQFLYQAKVLPHFISNNMLFIPSTAMLIYFFALGNGAISKICCNKLTALISDYSVEVFLLHCVVISSVTPVVNFLSIPYAVKQVAFVVFTVILTIFAAYIYRKFSQRFPFFAVK